MGAGGVSLNQLVETYLRWQPPEYLADPTLAEVPGQWFPDGDAVLGDGVSTNQGSGQIPLQEESFIRRDSQPIYLS